MPEEKKIEIIKVENHVITQGSLKQHTADVTMSAAVLPEDYSVLVDHVSAKVGYHPHGYGIYGSRSVTPTGPNQYRLIWKTGNHCD